MGVESVVGGVGTVGGENPHFSQKRREVGHSAEAGGEEQIPRLRLRNDKQMKRVPTVVMTNGLRGGIGWSVWDSRKKLTRKQRGEMAEAAFLAVAATLGLRVSKPWGESSRYDLIVDTGKKLLRVQVKSAHRAGEYGGYTFHAHGNSSRVYGADEIDVLAAYVVPVGAWYLFPVEEFRKYKAMKLFPKSRRRRSKFEKFREAWWMMGVEL